MSQKQFCFWDFDFSEGDTIEQWKDFLNFYLNELTKIDPSSTNIIMHTMKCMAHCEKQIAKMEEIESTRIGLELSHTSKSAHKRK